MLSLMMTLCNRTDVVYILGRLLNLSVANMKPLETIMYYYTLSEIFYSFVTLSSFRKSGIYKKNKIDLNGEILCY